MKHNSDGLFVVTVILIMLAIGGLLGLIFLEARANTEDLSTILGSQELFSNIYEYCDIQRLAESQEGCEELASDLTHYILFGD